MAETKAANGFIPEVWADLAQANFKGKARVLGLARIDDTLVGQPGDEVDFPKWNTLGEMEELTEGVAMTTEVLSQTTGKAKVKAVGKAVEFTDERQLYGMGSVATEALRQFGVLAARAVDKALITAAAAETEADGGKMIREQKPYKLDLSSTTKDLSWNVMVDAFTMFGDDFEATDFAGLVIRSPQMGQLMKDDNFINASKLGGASPLLTGQLGSLGGLPVIVSDRLPEHQFMLVRSGALGVLYKQRPVIESDRDILKRTTVVTTHLHFAVKRLMDTGVLIGTLQA